MKKSIYLLLFSIFLVSCVREDFFGLSGYGNIKSMVVSNQSGNAKIDSKTLTVEVEIPAGIDLSAITIQSMEISTFATSDIKVGDALNLNDPQTITIISEDGTSHLWTIESFVASVTPQLDNWKLDQWYKTGSGYYEPGATASTTIWGTGNQGTQILNKLATLPFDFGNGNLGAHMITLDNGRLAGTFGAPISTGSLFTGYFDSDKLDPSNPQAAVVFGTPFSGRPEKLRFKYQYQPGAVNKDKSGNELDFGDMLDIYALLEIRFGGKTERLATAWFRSGDAQSGMTTREVDFIYAALDASYPDYMKPIDHGYVSEDSAAFVLPTHITFVASSSFDGANFAGAIDSDLIIDDVEMVYDE